MEATEKQCMLFFAMGQFLLGNNHGCRKGVCSHQLQAYSGDVEQSMLREVRLHTLKYGD